MKSTGLFGKNSGRVGGVVYSNFRGEQIVRSYQPKVSNPNTPLQVAQRAKFKLVSQIGSALGKEIAASFIPTVRKETSRNAWVKKMLKKTIYSDKKASLPIEEIVLTNSSATGIQVQNISETQITGTIPASFATETTKVRAVFISYVDGGDISIEYVAEAQVDYVDVNEPASFIISQFSLPDRVSVRAILYAYDREVNSSVSYEDYATLAEEAELQDIVAQLSGGLRFSESLNVKIPRNV